MGNPAFTRFCVPFSQVSTQRKSKQSNPRNANQTVIKPANANQTLFKRGNLTPRTKIKQIKKPATKIKTIKHGNQTGFESRCINLEFDMDKKELMAAIDRVRRVMGRNADVMLICDYAQGELTQPTQPILQSFQVETNEATASQAPRGGARPGAGRKPTGKALSAAERSRRHREAKDTSATPSSEGWPLIGER